MNVSEFVPVIGSLLTSHAGRYYQMDVMNPNVRFMHESHFEGGIRFYSTVDELAANCKFPQAKSYLEGILGGKQQVWLIEDSKEGQAKQWWILADEPVGPLQPQAAEARPLKRERNE